MMNLRIFVSLLLFTAAFSLNAAENTKFGADRHIARGMACENCHGAKREIAYPDINQCTSCHNPDELVKKTEGTLPKNPHTSPHYENKLDCTLCHVQHGPTENYCSQCHKFDFKVP